MDLLLHSRIRSQHLHFRLTISQPGSISTVSGQSRPPGRSPSRLEVDGTETSRADNNQARYKYLPAARFPFRKQKHGIPGFANKGFAFNQFINAEGTVQRQPLLFGAFTRTKLAQKGAVQVVVQVCQIPTSQPHRPQPKWWFVIH
uniref:Uncharacterized protein n=1 Tax=Anopheles farauti TaxID=69004 RepID=A0A182QHW7_9DIPT